MQETCVLRLGFERMPERMPEVQDPAQSRFPLVGAHHLRLDSYRFSHNMFQRLRVLTKNLLMPRFHQPEKWFRRDNPVLNDLVKPGAILAHRKRGKNLGINEHGERLMKRSDQVFSRDQIAAGLATHCGVYLGEQCSGNLDDRNAAHKNCGEKPGQIGDDSAPERNHDAGTISTQRRHLFGKLFHVGEALILLAAGEENCVKRHMIECRANLSAV
jgi:hypothetical protein